MKEMGKIEKEKKVLDQKINSDYEGDKVEGKKKKKKKKKFQTVEIHFHSSNSRAKISPTS